MAESYGLSLLWLLGRSMRKKVEKECEYQSLKRPDEVSTDDVPLMEDQTTITTSRV